MVWLIINGVNHIGKVCCSPCQECLCFCKQFELFDLLEQRQNAKKILGSTVDRCCWKQPGITWHLISSSKCWKSILALNIYFIGVPINKGMENREREPLFPLLDHCLMIFCRTHWCYRLSVSDFSPV